jgi:hypothetical protein
MTLNILYKDSKQKARVNADHWLRRISSASTTRLSQWDPWLSVPRLLVVWLYRDYLQKVQLNNKQLWCQEGTIN